MQKIDKNSPSAHHRPTLPGYILVTTAHIDNRKNLLNSDISSRRPHSMVNLQPTSGWDLLANLEQPANFNGFTSWQLYCTAL